MAQAVESIRSQPEVAQAADANDWLKQSKRVTLVALPFIALYKPLSLPIALGWSAVNLHKWGTKLVDGLQEETWENVPFPALEIVVIVCAVAGKFFAVTVLRLVKPTHDIIFKSYKLYENVQREEYEKGVGNGLAIIGSAVYISVLLIGGVELAIVSLVIQILFSLYKAQDVYRHEEKYLEPGGYALMSLVKTYQLTNKIASPHPA